MNNRNEINMVNFLKYVRTAEDYAASFVRDNPGTQGAQLFREYVRRLNWIANDLLTTPKFSQASREFFRTEIQADSFMLPALAEKIALLPENNRAALEEFIDSLLNGGSISAVTMEEEK